MGQKQKGTVEQVRAFLDKARDITGVRSKQFVTKARRLQMKAKLRLPQDQKYRFCRHCNTYWHPGKTVRIRTTKGLVVFTCLVCKRMRKKRVK